MESTRKDQVSSLLNTEDAPRTHTITNAEITRRFFGLTIPTVS
jgi:multidrug resistance protein, MATE family